MRAVGRRGCAGWPTPAKPAFTGDPPLWVPIHVKLGEFSLSDEPGSTRGGVGWRQPSSRPDL